MEFHNEQQDRENVEEDEEEEDNEEELDVDMIGCSVSLYPNRLAEPQTAEVPKPIRYKECRKNHAVGIGGHAVDGCGEFIASGAEGTLDALVCAACNCHRNFHRKESYSGATGALPLSVVERGPARAQYPVYRDPHWYQPPMGPPALQHHPRPLALPPVNAAMFDLQEDAWHSPIGGANGGGSGSSRKRFRTKFTQEQKDRMLSLAEGLGWRIQKQDEAAVDRFCCETGVKKQVLKVWMHNNKNSLAKKP